MERRYHNRVRNSYYWGLGSILQLVSCVSSIVVDSLLASRGFFPRVPQFLLLQHGNFQFVIEIEDK